LNRRAYRQAAVGLPIRSPNNQEVTVADSEDDDLIVVPLPGGETEEERQRIRKSNDRDQDLERHGEASRHNRGYDEAADGAARTPEIERVVEEE
jgi:hypothetical protein